MSKKKFDPTHHNYGLEGERFAFCWLTKLGYVVEAKGDQYGPDLHIHHPEWGLTPVEIERRYERSWKSGMFIRHLQPPREAVPEVKAFAPDRVIGKHGPCVARLPQQRPQGRCVRSVAC